MEYKEFLSKARKIYGNRYEYSDDNFGKSGRVKITCKTHGIFTQRIYDHLHNHGCPECGKEQYKRKNSEKASNSFISKAEKVHGSKYDYSKVSYINSKIPVEIVCKIHGPFLQSATNHLSGQGCPKCARNQKLTAEEVIYKLREVYNDSYLFNKVNYKNLTSSLILICRKHGEFSLKASSALRGVKCPKCRKELFKDNLLELSRKSEENFFQKARKIHGNKYDYSKVNYKNSKTPIAIVCPKHGEFNQTPCAHLKGTGCPKCGIEKNKSKLLSNTDEFVEKAKKIHDNKYDYSKVNYKSATAVVTIVCPKHGEFNQTPHAHLKGSGCPKCGKENSVAKTIEFYGKSTRLFIEEARKIHGDHYDYSMVEYKNTYMKVKIKCNVCNLVFEQKPSKHVNSKQGCPRCRSSHYERLIENFLIKKGIKYEREKTFDDLLSERGNKLRFDFYLPDFNTCVEYDGNQHHKHVEWMMSKESFELLKKHDAIKNEYCKMHGIKLIRISGGESKKLVWREIE